MLTPEEFPYIKSLYVNDCYAYQDFNIELRDYKPFSHLILTGKNGSGKSTILRAAHPFSAQGMPWQWSGNDKVILSYSQPAMSQYGPPPYDLSQISKSISFVSSFFQAKRQSQPNQVTSLVKEAEFTENFSRIDDKFTLLFKQYLVNKKIEQAFYQIENRKDLSDRVEFFFFTLTKHFQEIFKDKNLQLEFQRENFEFFIKLSDGQRLTFDVLSEGFSAFISIIMDLLMRVDLIRKQANDYSYEPCGIVRIDEPETHLHLQLQEQVLPLLTSLFPNIQFIAATHSPAVIASIKNATIFDLTTKESRGSEETVGRSYSDLMVSHFGLENEYSETADAIIKQVNEVLNSFAGKPVELKDSLQRIYDTNSVYLSPTLKVELELLIAQQASHQEVNQ